MILKCMVSIILSQTTSYGHTKIETKFTPSNKLSLPTNRILREDSDIK